MKKATMGDLQESLADKSGFKQLGDYKKFCSAYLALVETARPTRIISPSHEHYVFLSIRQGQQKQNHPPA